MKHRIDSHYLHVNSGAGAEVFKALGSETRLEILSLLVSGDRNINEICLQMNLSQPTISKHIQILEQVGLIDSEYMPGTQGMQKRCRLRYSQMIVSFESAGEVEEKVEEISMPVGLYSLAEASPHNAAWRTETRLLASSMYPKLSLIPNARPPKFCGWQAATSNTFFPTRFPLRSKFCAWNSSAKLAPKRPIITTIGPPTLRCGSTMSKSEPGPRPATLAESVVRLIPHGGSTT